MQTVSATLAAAITSPVRRPVVSVVVDWLGSTTYDDLSAAAGPVSVQRTVTTDLPAEANLVAGGAAGQASVDLATDVAAGVSPADLLSPYRPYLAGSPRVNRPVTVMFGFVTDAGTEWMPGFVGKTRSATARPDGTAALSALDGSELLPVAVTLPPVLALDPGDPATRGYGLNAQWVMDYILRANDFYASPPVRVQCAVSATLHGSTRPEVGAHLASYTYRGSITSPQGAARFEALSSGLLGLSGGPGDSGGTMLSRAQWTPAATLSVSSGATLFVEFHKVKLHTSGQYLAYFTAGSIVAPTTYVYLLGTTAGVTVEVSRAGASVSTAVACSGFTLDVEHYVGVSITFTAAGFDVRAAVDTNRSATVSGVVGNPTGNPALDTVTLDAFTTTTAGPSQLVKSGFQATTEAYVSTMFNDTFVPTATLDESLNELQAMAPVEDAAAWPLLQELAAAEAGVALFDEAGVFRFYNRDTANDAGTAVTTVTAARNLIDDATSEAVDTVRNTIRVPSSTVTVDASMVEIWSLSEVTVIPAGTTLNLSAATTGLVVDLMTLAYFSGAPASSGYRAAQNADGTGGDVSNLIVTNLATFPSRIEVGLYNPNAFAVWLVDNSLGTPGTPMLQLWGRLARPSENPYQAIAPDSGSVATYGQQALEVPANAWRQTAPACDLLAAALLAQLRDPHPVLSDVQTVGDPRVQLLDLVTLMDEGGIGWARDCRVVGITRALDASGLRDTYTLRDVGRATLGITGTLVWDDSSTPLDSTYGWA